MESSIGRAIGVFRVRGLAAAAAAVDAANAVDAVAGGLEFPREIAALDLRGAQFADALGNAPAFDVIGIVGDLRAVVVPIGPYRRSQPRGTPRRPSTRGKAAAAAGGGDAGPRVDRTSARAAWRRP